MSWEIRQGDALVRLREMPECSVQTCITSPPYFGLRDYGTGEWEGGDPLCEHRVSLDSRVQKSQASSTLGGGRANSGHTHEGYHEVCGRCGATRIDSQLGLEPTPDAYGVKLVEVFSEVKRVLRDDGTLWLNLGDSYASSSTYNTTNTLHTKAGWKQDADHRPNSYAIPGVKPKDLLGIPWMVAFALRADGWYLRSEIIWAKPNPMPESVTDRPTKAHEQVFLLSKSARYFYDAAAIAEPNECDRLRGPALHGDLVSTNGNAGLARRDSGGTRNRRSVWTVATQPYPEAHFAVYPEALVLPMVLAGAPAGGTVLDPFAGAGTTLKVAVERGREAIGIELNPEYVALVERRLGGVTEPLFGA